MGAKAIFGVSVDIQTVLSNVGGTAYTVVFFILALSVIVFVHEYGHYIVGRWTGIKAEVFSLGFGKVLASRTDKHGTRWQIAAIPFGGFVKFLGDANAASGKDGQAMAVMSASEARHTMHGAPLWARAATVAAGPIFNFILAIFVYFWLILYTGIATDLPVIGKIQAMPLAGTTLLAGDQILSVNDIDTSDLKTFVKIAKEIPPAAQVRYKVLRDTNEVMAIGPHPMPPLVAGVQPKSAALDAGMKVGDVILEADGKPVYAFDEMPEIVKATKGAPLALKIWRDGEIQQLTLTPRVRTAMNADNKLEDRWMIGLSGALLFEPETRNAGIYEALTLAASQSWFVITGTLSGIWNMITGAISSCGVSGPIGMAEVIGDSARMGAMDFVSMLAVISIGVGLMNLFPIPILDGGHLVFYAYEAVIRRPPSDRVMRVLMSSGLFIIISFMLFGLSNDLFCA
jgi:regulator of sigma E protease